MERSDSTDNFFPMSTGNVRNLARLFESPSSSQETKRSNLFRLKSKSSSSITRTTKALEIHENGQDDQTTNLSFRDIHSKFESGRMKTSYKSTNSLESLKLLEIKEISQRTDEIVAKIKKSVKLASSHYIDYLNEIVELLLKIGQVDTYGNAAIQTEKLSALQILQKSYSQLREKLQVFLVDDSDEPEEGKVNIRASIQKFESMIENKVEVKTPVFQPAYVPNGQPKIVVEKTQEPQDVVRAVDQEDDDRILEGVKVQNLKNLWERRVSNGQDSAEEAQQSAAVGLLINYETRESGEVTTQENQENTETPNEGPIVDTTEEILSIGQVSTREEVVAIAEMSDTREDTTTSPEKPDEIFSDIECFIREERKSTSENLLEPEVIPNEIQVEFVAEKPEEVEETCDITETTEQTGLETNPIQEIDVGFGPPQSTEVNDEPVPDNEFLIIVDQPDENGNQIPNDTSLSLDARDPQATTEVATNDTSLGLIESSKEEELVSTDGQVLSKEQQQAISDTKNFLKEERKASQQTPNEKDEFLVGEIDPKFGPPTGIIPSLDPAVPSAEEPVQEKEEVVPDNTFTVIVDKPEDSSIPNDTSLSLVGDDNPAQPMVEEVNQITMSEPLVNGDKDVGTK